MNMNAMGCQCQLVGPAADNAQEEEEVPNTYFVGSTQRQAACLLGARERERERALLLAGKAVQQDLLSNFIETTPRH